MDVTSSPTPPSDAPPDWATVTCEITCPLCEYNLRGLAEPRCPECGYPFAWSQLLAEQINKHPYLFEHHPHRNIWSFFRTASGTLLPKRFWRTVTPTMTLYPRRLIAYGVLSTLPLLFVVAVILVHANATKIQAAERARLAMINLLRLNATPQQKDMIQKYGSIEAYIEAEMHLLPWWKWAIGHARVMLPVVFFCSVPELTFLALLIYRTSMRRARVRAGHILRCVVYSSDILIWAAVLSAIPLVMSISVNGPFQPNPPRENWIVSMLLCSTLGALVSSLIVFPCRLAIAYRRYLHFPHAIATVILSVIVAVLAALALLSLSQWL